MSRKFLSPIGVLARATDPAGASAGDLYYNTTNGCYKQYTGSAWENLVAQPTDGLTGGTIFTGDTTPTSAISGDLWVDTSGASNNTGYKYSSTTLLTTGTAATYTVPAGTKALKICMVGGGGGGGGATVQPFGAGGGGAGGYVESFITSPSTTYTYTVGAAGTGTTTTGNAGTSTTFSTFTAGGGAGGVGGTTGGNGGAGGTATGGDLNTPGQPGGIGSRDIINAYSGGSNVRPWSGAGASTRFGSGGLALPPGGANTNGNAGTGYGSGGSGAAGGATAPSQTGGSGTGGIIVVEVYV